MKLLCFLRLLFKHLYTLPWSPEGRKMRIARLVRNGHTIEDSTAVVYGRDIARGFPIREDEMTNLHHILGNKETR